MMTPVADNSSPPNATRVEDAGPSDDMTWILLGLYDSCGGTVLAASQGFLDRDVIVVGERAEDQGIEWDATDFRGPGLYKLVNVSVRVSPRFVVGVDETDVWIEGDLRPVAAYDAERNEFSFWATDDA